MAEETRDQKLDPSPEHEAIGKHRMPNPNAPIDSEPVRIDPIFEGQDQVPQPPEHPMTDHPGSPKTPLSAGNNNPGYLTEDLDGKGVE